MRKNADLLWIILFIIFFAVPVPLSFLIPDSPSMENRKLAGFPELKIENYANFPQQFEEFFNDHLPFKNKITSIYNGIIYYTFHESTKEQYIVGKENWLFYNGQVVNDGDSIGQYTGEKQYSQKELDLFVENIDKQAEWLKKQNIELVIFIPSNKEEVYYKYMPDYIKISDNNCCDFLVEYLRKNTSVKIVYPKDELISYGEKYKIYQKYDTHWNEIGAFIGVQKLKEAIVGEKTFLESVTIETSGYTNADGLSLRMNIANFLPEEEIYTIKEYAGMSFEGKVYPHKIMVVGDSFGVTPMVFLSKDFESATRVYRGEYSQELFDEFKPDVVVLEFIERYIDQLKDFSLFQEENE